MKNYLFKICVFFVIALCLSCQSLDKMNTLVQRNVSSNKLEKKHFNIEFALLLNQYTSLLNKSPQALDALLDKEVFYGPILKTSKKAYYYMFEFDRRLEELAKKCEDRLSGCENAMNMSVYKRLIAYRFISKENQEALKYFYLRLIDLANYNLSAPSFYFQETKEYVDRLPGQEHQTLKIEQAQKIVNRLHQRASIYITTDLMKQKNGITFYENALEIKHAMEKLDYEWQLATGGRPANGLKLNHLGFNIQEEINKNYLSNKHLIKSEVATMATVPDDPSVQEFVRNIGKSESRIPQSEFLNISGRSFKVGEWALTYDDGPKASVTNQILNTLNESNINATFFNLAKNVQKESNQAVLKKAQGLGMGLAHHSYSHKDLNKSNSNLNKQITQAKQVLEDVYEDYVNYFRLPYGSGTKNPRVQNYIANSGMYHFFWTVDSLDWKDPDPQSILNRIVNQMKIQKRGIILLHDIRQRTADVTVLFADYLKRNNIKISSLSDLIEGQGLKRSNSGPDFIPKPIAKIEYPHGRIIEASALKVRSTPDFPGGNINVCGHHVRGDAVMVMAFESGWYKVELQKQKLVNFDSTGHCADLTYGYISAKSKYSSWFN